MTARLAFLGMAALLICFLPACSPDGDKETNAAQTTEAGPLSDAAARAFFGDHSCNACHEVDELRIGPTYRDVAIRYAGDDREARADWLAQKIIHGGAGSWGTVPMVTNPNVTQQKARAIAGWILALDAEQKTSR